MRWREEKLVLGAQRTVRKFLWLPVCIGGESRWLERATILQEVMKVREQAFRLPFSYDVLKWQNASWVARLSHVEPSKPWPRSEAWNG